MCIHKCGLKTNPVPEYSTVKMNAKRFFYYYYYIKILKISFGNFTSFRKS